MDDLTRPSFLSYRGPEAPLPEPPPRVYARVDQIEPIESRTRGELSAFAGDRIALLDSVDARWFDVYVRKHERLAEPVTIDGNTGDPAAVAPGSVQRWSATPVPLLRVRLKPRQR